MGLKLFKCKKGRLGSSRKVAGPSVKMTKLGRDEIKSFRKLLQGIDLTSLAPIRRRKLIIVMRRIGVNATLNRLRRFIKVSKNKSLKKKVRSDILFIMKNFIN